jgi:Flp pilus assembly protein TadG
MKRLRDYWTGESGAAAVEFGLVFPVLIMLMLGVVGFSMLGGAINGMHFAVEEAARCYAVNKLTCGTGDAAAEYAQTHYLGPDVKPVFVASNTGCGFTVSGTANFQIQLAVFSLDVPLNASACYPGRTAAAA